jgi:hypothetical protein
MRRQDPFRATAVRSDVGPIQLESVQLQELYNDYTSDATHSGRLGN